MSDVTQYECHFCGKPFTPTLADIRYRKYRCKPCRAVMPRTPRTQRTRDQEAVNRAGKRKDYNATKRAWSARNKAKRRRIYAESFQRHKEKQRARIALHRAVNAGTVMVPWSCTECGNFTKLHGHHDDYNQPLKVAWLCSTCHAKRHLKYG